MAVLEVEQGENNTARAQEDKEDMSVDEVTHEKENQPPVDSDAGADLPPSYTDVEEGDLPGYDTISEKTRKEVKYKLMFRIIGNDNFLF